MTSGPDFWDELHTQIRLGGAWIDGAGALQYQWEDLDIFAAADQFFNPSQPVSGAAALPATPEDQNWKIKTLSSKFDSGVLTLDVTNAYKIFAAHHVVATNQGQNPVPPVDRHDCAGTSSTPTSQTSRAETGIRRSRSSAQRRSTA